MKQNNYIPQLTCHMSHMWLVSSQPQGHIEKEMWQIYTLIGLRTCLEFFLRSCNSRSRFKWINSNVYRFYFSIFQPYGNIFLSLSLPLSFPRLLKYPRKMLRFGSHITESSSVLWPILLHTWKDIILSHNKEYIYIYVIMFLKIYLTYYKMVLC